MDNYERQLLEQAIDLLSRIIGYADARADTKPVLRFVDASRETQPTTPTNDRGVVLQFPNAFRATLVEETEQGAVVSSQKEVLNIFSDEEISKMPRKFRKIFRTNKQTAHVRKKDGDVYEIRMQINGHRITASAKYLDLAKERFIKKLRKYNECGAEAKKNRRKSRLRFYLIPFQITPFIISKLSNDRMFPKNIFLTFAGLSADILRDSSAQLL